MGDIPFMFEIYNIRIGLRQQFLQYKLYIQQNFTIQTTFIEVFELHFKKFVTFNNTVF
jgi:hypothetical protein